MKKLKSKEDFAVKTKNIFNALTQHVPDSKHEQARRFFLKSVSTRIAILLIMSNFLKIKKLQPLTYTTLCIQNMVQNHLLSTLLVLA